MPAPEFFLFMPQMRLSMEKMVERARAAEAANFAGIALIDHIAPHGAADASMYESFVTATWLAAHTTTLRVGQLVVYDSLRAPALLAKMATTLNHASQGRYDLGIGAGSVRLGISQYGYSDAHVGDRLGRLDESLEVFRRLTSEDNVTFAGKHHQLENVTLNPKPVSPIPIIVGGSGPRTAAVASKHADYWNFRIHEVGSYDEARRRAGNAKLSTQNMVTFITDESKREEQLALAASRFGGVTISGDGAMVGNVVELTAQFSEQASEGVIRIYVWLTDFAPPATIAQFGEVIARCTGRHVREDV